MAVRVSVINAAALWKRIALLLVFGSLLAGGLSHVASDLRSIRMAHRIGDIESLNASVQFDPNQAETHAQLGFAYLHNPFSYDPAQAVHHFEAALRIHPFDFEAWSNLGSAYELQGDAERAERAFQTGVSLAPHYFSPRWAYGNFLLRQGKIEQSLTQFRFVADINPTVMGTICNLVWQTTRDAQRLVELGTQLRTGSAKERVCRCLIDREAYQAAFDLWGALPDDDPGKPDLGRALVDALKRAQQWPQARVVWQQVVKAELGEDAARSSSDPALWDGDFEGAVKRLDWKLRSTREVEVGLDSSASYRGQQALLLDFKPHQNVRFGSVTHDLWVEPSTRYRLQFYYRTEKMRPTTGLALMVSDAESAERFRVESEALEGRDDWTKKEFVFETPAETHVLQLRIVRRPVSQMYDFIKGKVWFDAFSLEVISSQ